MKKPWESEKVWLSILAVAALVALAQTDAIVLQADHIVWIFGALIGGQALEGFANNWRQPPTPPSE